MAFYSLRCPYHGHLADVESDHTPPRAWCQVTEGYCQRLLIVDTTTEPTPDEEIDA